MRARKAPASPLPPSAEGRITRLAALHVHEPIAIPQKKMRRRRPET
jgi:hypothetical protein